MSKIQKAVSEIKSIEELANEDRWVNQVHPLVKLCVTILYIGTVVSFSKYNLSGLLVMAVYPVILFIMNDISVKDALWRMRSCCRLSVWQEYLTLFLTGRLS